MKKVLFITYFFPPLGGAGVGRSLKFSKYLIGFGWEPIVISADENVHYGKDYCLMKEVPNDMKVYRVGHKEKTREWKYLCKKMKVNFEFPDSYKYWYKPAFKKAKEIIEKENIDIIFSSSEPFISHFIAMDLKKEYNIPWIADFRDPWSGNDFIDIYNKQFLLNVFRKSIAYRTKKAEEKIVNNADKVTVVSSGHKDQLLRTYKDKEGSIEVIANGYDEMDFIGIKKRAFYPEKTTITYVGSFYEKYKELTIKFLKVLEKTNKGTEFIVIGKATEEMKSLNQDNLTCIYHFPKEKLLSFCLGSDFLFILTMPGADWVVSGKMFEYFRLNRPIIALVPENGDAAKLIKKAGAGFVISYDEEIMREQIIDIIEKKKSGYFDNFNNNMEFIKQFERKKLTEKLATVFDDVCISYNNKRKI